MGTLIYGDALRLEMDDRTLAHLRSVVFAKLRGHESLPITVLYPTESHGERSTSFWVSSDTPVAFCFSGEETIELSRDWIEELMRMSYSNGGIVVTQQ